MSDECVFCGIAAHELPAQIIAEDERTLSFMDIYPGARGHALVIPKLHFRDLWEIERQDLEAVVLASQQLAVRMRDRLDAEGVNLINSCGPAAWQSVFHFHVHVIPRYAEDPLKLPWQPSEGDAEELAALAEQLR